VLFAALPKVTAVAEGVVSCRTPALRFVVLAAAVGRELAPPVRSSVPWSRLKSV
jgi:hypothetical protein